jgi:glycosyltransferase involved in cell wall biosynthesis
MRILFVNWSRVEFAGGEKHLLFLVREIMNRGQEVMLLCPAGSPLAQRAAAQGIPLAEATLEFFKKIKPWPYISSVLSVNRVIKQFHPDIIHAQGAHSLHWLLPYTLFSNIHIVCQLQDFEIHHNFSRWAMRRIPLCISVTDALRKHLVKEYGISLEKCPIITPGVNMPDSDPKKTKALRKEMGLNSGDVAVGICGRIHSRKGQHLFVQAAGMLKNEPGLKWFIVGDRGNAEEAYPEKLDEMIRGLKLKDKVRFTGFISDMPLMLDALDVVAIPSSVEPIGLITLEVQAKQKPVIVSNVGGLPEAIIPDITGTIMEEYTAECLAWHVLDMARNKKKRLDMGVAGKKFYQRSFTIAENARAILEQYRKLICS